MSGSSSALMMVADCGSRGLRAMRCATAGGSWITGEVGIVAAAGFSSGYGIEAKSGSVSAAGERNGSFAGRVGDASKSSGMAVDGFICAGSGGGGDLGNEFCRGEATYVPEVAIE
jgi:hypothetical protein